MTFARVARTPRSVSHDDDSTARRRTTQENVLLAAPQIARSIRNRRDVENRTTDAMASTHCVHSMNLRSSNWFGTGLLVASFAALVLAEWGRPLRRRVEPRARRWPVNASLGIIAAGFERGLVVGALAAASSFAARHRVGLHRCEALPRAVRSAAALLGLDLGMYVWHRMSHQVPVLWRFHAVHHTDLDLDLTTAARLHPGELLLSIPVRSLHVLLLGATLREVLGYELLMQLASLFYHADVNLGANVERWSGTVWMTPGLHTRHHSATRSVRDCNWGVVLTIWDRVFNSLERQPARDEALGIANVRHPERLGVGA